MNSGTFVPLGKISVVTVGTPVTLDHNSGSSERTDNWQDTPPLRGLMVRADAGNTKNVYLMLGSAAASTNPGLILAALAPGASATFPMNSGSWGCRPEDVSVDADTAGNIVYACGTRE